MRGIFSEHGSLGCPKNSGLLLARIPAPRMVRGVFNHYVRNSPRRQSSLPAAGRRRPETAPSSFRRRPESPPRRHSSLPAAGRRKLESSGLDNPFPPDGNDHKGYPRKHHQHNPPNTPARLPRPLVPDAALPPTSCRRGFQLSPACSRQAGMTTRRQDASRQS